MSVNDKYPTYLKDGINTLPTHSLGQCSFPQCDQPAVFSCFNKAAYQNMEEIHIRGVSCGKGFCEAHTVKKHIAVQGDACSCARPHSYIYEKNKSLVGGGKKFNFAKKRVPLICCREADVYYGQGKYILEEYYVRVCAECWGKWKLKRILSTVALIFCAPCFAVYILFAQCLSVGMRLAGKDEVGAGPQTHPQPA